MTLAIGPSSTRGTPTVRSLYRRQERIPADLGTAVNVVAMVFGNMGMDSGTGVAFTRDPATGAQGVYGDYLQNAQGEDVVAGIRNTVPLPDLEGIDKDSYDQLMQIMPTLENHYQRPVRHRVHDRARQAVDAADAGRQAHRRRCVPDRLQLVDQGLIELDEALRRVTRRRAGQADVPPVRRRRRSSKIALGDQRVSWRGGRQGRLRLGTRRRAGRPW